MRYSVAFITIALIGFAPTVAANCTTTAISALDAPFGARPRDVQVGSRPNGWSPFGLSSFRSRTARRMGIPYRPTETPFEYSSEELELLESELADALSRPFAAVSESQRPPGDALILQAELSGVDPGTRVLRAMFGATPAVAFVHARLQTEAGRPLAAFECSRETRGGLLGVGGWVALWQSGRSLVVKDFDKIGRDLFSEVAQLADRASRLARRPHQETRVAVSRYQKLEALDKPAARWSIADATKVLASFQVRSDDARGVGGAMVELKGVHGLWWTRYAYQAFTRTQELLTQGSKPRWLHPFATALDTTTLRNLMSQPGYVISVWPFDSPPVYWNPDEILRSTVLRSVIHPDRHVAPTALVGPPSPPAVFVFPRHDSFGSPLIDRDDQQVELATVLNGREIICRFDLSRFRLRSIDDLTAVDAARVAR
jgi:hypothetical protein